MTEMTLGDRMGRMETMMEQLIDMVAKNNEAIFAVIERLDKLENQQEKTDVKIDRIEKTVNQRDYNLQALNKRVFETEAQIEKLTNQ